MYWIKLFLVVVLNNYVIVLNKTFYQVLIYKVFKLICIELL